MLFYFQIKCQICYAVWEYRLSLYSHNSLNAWRLCMLSLKGHDVWDHSFGNFLAAYGGHLGWCADYKTNKVVAIRSEAFFVFRTH